MTQNTVKAIEEILTSSYHKDGRLNFGLAVFNLSEFFKKEKDVKENEIERLKDQIEYLQECYNQR